MRVLQLNTKIANGKPVTKNSLYFIEDENLEEAKKYAYLAENIREHPEWSPEKEDELIEDVYCIFDDLLVRHIDEAPPGIKKIRVEGIVYNVEQVPDKMQITL